ncbi:hypothetical protein PENTCL1PPCAC_19269, partial [Pristionchus entomophagus]
EWLIHIIRREQREGDCLTWSRREHWHWLPMYHILHSDTATGERTEHHLALLTPVTVATLHFPSLLGRTITRSRIR